MPSWNQKNKNGEEIRSAAIFDFDGTLVDSFTPRKAAHSNVSEYLSSYINTLGYEVDRGLLLDLVKDIEIEMNAKKAYERNLWWKEVLNRCLSKTTQIPKSVLAKATTIYWKTVGDNSPVYEGVEEMLNSLQAKAIMLGLISDTDGLEGMKGKRILKSGLKGFFEAIVVAGEDTPEIKPSIQPFVKICELLSVSPESCVFVGDNPKVDVLGAKELKMKIIIIGNKNPTPGKVTPSPDFFVEGRDFKELTRIIVGLFDRR